MTRSKQVTMSTFPRMAFKAKAPYIGIPVEGKRPFAVKRDLFIAVTRGINITDWSIEPAETHGGRNLVIVHRTGKARGRYVFYESNPHLVKSTLLAWADKQRKVRTIPKLDKFEKQIAKVRKGLQTPRIPRNPLLPSKFHYEGNYLSGRELAWKLDAPKRKVLAHIAGLVLTSKMTSGHGYKAVRDAGFALKTYSQVPVHRGRKIYADENAYWRALPEICGLAQSPRDSFFRSPFEFNGAGMIGCRNEYIGTIRQNEAINAQIAALTAMRSDTYQAIAVASERI
jgi:hypothetical protein